MPAISTIAVSDLGSVTITISNEGVITIAYPGQNSITISATSYGQIYTYGLLGSSTNPLVLAVKTCSAPTGLRSESYINNSSLAIHLGSNTSSKYAIIGNGDLRPMGNNVAISNIVDNPSCNSGSPSYPNYIIAKSSGSGTIMTFYHP